MLNKWQAEKAMKSAINTQIARHLDGILEVYKGERNALNGNFVLTIEARPDEYNIHLFEYDKQDDIADIVEVLSHGQTA